MARAVCQNEDCQHSWNLSKPPGEFSDGPKCSECGGYAVEIEGAPAFDESILETGSGRVESMQQALQAVPGIGSSAVEYVTFWCEEGAAGENPNELYDLLLELDGVDPQKAERVTEATFSEWDRSGGGGDRPAFERAEESEPSRSPLVEATEALTNLHEIAQDTAGGGGTQDIAEAVGESISPALEELAKGQRQIAAALVDDDDEDRVESLEEELRELRESRRDEELESLREEVESLRTARAVESGRLPPEALENEEVASEYLAISSLENGMSRLADIIERKAPAPDEADDLLNRVVWAMQNPPPGQPGWSADQMDEEGAPENPLRDFYTSPNERGGVESVDSSDFEGEAGEERDLEDVPPVGDGGGSTEAFKCGVCGEEFTADPSGGYPSCPSCGDGSPSPVEEEAVGDGGTAAGGEPDPGAESDAVRDLWDAYSSA